MNAVLYISFIMCWSAGLLRDQSGDHNIVAMPLSPICEGCKERIYFCFFETQFLTATETQGVRKQSGAGVQAGGETRVQGSFILKPRENDPVEMGSSLGRRPRDICQAS